MNSRYGIEMCRKDAYVSQVDLHVAGDLKQTFGIFTDVLYL